MALPSKPTSPDKAAAQRAAQQEVFLREVDDALRQDQVAGFYRTYGKPLLAAIVVGLVAFGGYLFWRGHEASQREARAEQLVQALDSINSGKLDEAKGKLDPLITANKGTNAAAARLLKAGIALQQKRLDDALALFRAVADDTSLPQPVRDLATVREVTANFDRMRPQAVIDRLKPLAAPGNAWFGAAGEMVAAAYLRQGKNQEAGRLLAAISKDTDVSDNLRSRAGQLAAVLGADSLGDVVDDKGQPLDGKGAEAQTASTVEENNDG